MTVFGVIFTCMLCRTAHLDFLEGMTLAVFYMCSDDFSV